MGLGTYRAVLRNRTVTSVIALSFITRVPLWAVIILVVLHVTDHLGMTYAAAGLISTVNGVAMVVSGPWRGHLLDKKGLRATAAPSIVVGLVVWSIAPWGPYWLLLILVGVSALFTVPLFSVVRMVIIGATTEKDRYGALALDGIAVEFSYMVGPILGAFLATVMPTSLALMLCAFAQVAGTIVFWVIDPPLKADADVEGAVPKPPRREWITPGLVFILLLTVVSTLILTGEELGSIAVVKEMGVATLTGVVLAVWAAGSASGGFVYGALRRHPPMVLILIALAATTLLTTVAQTWWAYALLLFLSGLFCSPMITSTVNEVGRLVPAAALGEAMGWHGSALTFGSSISAPIVGAAIDAGGWRAGLGLPGAIGLALALVALVAYRRRAAAPGTAAEPAELTRR